MYEWAGVSQSSGLFPGAFTPSLAHAGSPAAPLSGVFCYNDNKHSKMAKPCQI